MTKKTETIGKINLPFDYCRCYGYHCDKRDTCQRHTDINNLPHDVRYAVSGKMCDDKEDYYIPEH